MDKRSTGTDPDHIDEGLSFYRQLFRALEFGAKKEERAILVSLFGNFGVPDDAPDPALWLADNRQPEDVMGWLMDEVEPFAKMLEELYQWLSDLRATFGGNIQEISFDFERLMENVAFSLESFPKEYVRKWGDAAAITARFDPRARGRLRVDTPNYWQDDVLAITNLSYAPVLEPSLIDRLPPGNRQAVLSRVQHAVGVLDREYLRKTVPAHIDVWPLRNHPILYVSSEAEWQIILELAQRPGAGRGLATSRSAADLNDYITSRIEAGTMVHGSRFIELMDHAGIKQAGTPTEDLQFHDDLESDDTYAFLRAYELCFSRSASTTRTWIDVVDRVLLPFWRHRWRLFEVWSILWLCNVLPEPYRPVPCLEAREGSPNLYLWTLPGGNAEHPVAKTETSGRVLSVWFQLSSSLGDGEAKRFGQKHIEPDLRLRELLVSTDIDLAILELKDRNLAPGGAEKRVARMYATTGARVVCVANYSPFRSQALRGRVYAETAGQTQIYLVDEFRPGSTAKDIEDAIRVAVAGARADVLVDVSGSMPEMRVRQVLAELPVDVHRWFRWSERFEEMRDAAAALANFSGGFTDLTQAIGAYERLEERSVGLILTDSDGAEQFTALRQQGIVDDARYLCIDVTQEFSPVQVTTWLHEHH